MSPERDAVPGALKELILPELQTIKQEQAELKSSLGIINQRLDINGWMT